MTDTDPNVPDDLPDEDEDDLPEEQTEPDPDDTPGR